MEPVRNNAQRIAYCRAAIGGLPAFYQEVYQIGVTETGHVMVVLHRDPKRRARVSLMGTLNEQPFWIIGLPQSGQTKYPTLGAAVGALMTVGGFV